MVLEGTRDGITDIGFEPTIFHPDKLPLEQISFVTPFVTSDVELVGRVINKLHAEIPAFREQYDKFGVVRLAGSSYRFLRAVHDLPGAEVRGHHGPPDQHGGRGAAMAARHAGNTRAEQHDALLQQHQDGVVDGFIIFPSAIPGMKYPEAAPYVTRVGFGAQYAAALIINKSVYDKLPAEIRTILHEAGEAWTKAADRAQFEAGNKGFDSVPEYPKGTNFTLSARRAGEMGQRDAEHRARNGPSGSTSRACRAPRR